MCFAYNSNNEMKEIIENDIDLLEYGGLKDPYFFCIRLLSLFRNKKKLRLKKSGHFKFLIEKDNEIIYQTPLIEDAFWAMKTHSISLNKQSLHFSVPDLNNSNTQFEMKMYRSLQNSVQQIASLQISMDTYIELFLEEDKKIFTETIALCPQYSLQYQIYIQKTKIQLDNLLAFGQNDTNNGAFKKKMFEFIQIDHEKVEILKKNSMQNNSRALRKSLHFNHKKMIKTKHENTQRQIIIKSEKKNLKILSFFSKINCIITQFFSKKQPLQKEGNQENTKSSLLASLVTLPHKQQRKQNLLYSQKINIKREQQQETTKKSFGSSIGEMQLKKSNCFAENKFFIAKIIITFVFTLIILTLMSSQSKKKIPIKWFKTSLF